MYLEYFEGFWPKSVFCVEARKRGNTFKPKTFDFELDIIITTTTTLIIIIIIIMYTYAPISKELWHLQKQANQKANSLKNTQT